MKLIKTKILFEIKHQYESVTTLGRAGKPEDVAKVVAFLVSDDADYLQEHIYPLMDVLLLEDSINHKNLKDIHKQNNT